jgi:hypothetical protein
MLGFALLLIRIGLVASVLLTAGVSAVPAQQRVGVNSAVNPEAIGAVPGASPRRLVIGQDVIFNEHITTAQTGQTQLLFVDESSMTVGPNSDLTIDQFVYDPKSGTGKLAMSATRGLLRYVGGKLSKHEDAVTLRTTTATLAVRGGVFIVQIHPNGATDVVFVFGKSLTITGLAGGVETVVRPGFQSTISPGGSPSPPAPAPTGLLAQFNQQLGGQTGGTGGATTVPTDTHVANSGISKTISGNLTQSVQQSVQNLVTTTTTTSTTNNASSSLTSTGTAIVASQPSPPGQVFDCVGIGACDTATITQVGTATATFDNGTLSNGIFNGTVGGGSFSFPLAIGTSTFSATGSSPGGAVSGTSFLSNDGAFYYAKLTAANGQAYYVSGGQAVPSSVLAPTGATRIFAFNAPEAPPAAPLYLVAPASTAIGAGSASRELSAVVTFSGSGSGQSSAVLVQTGTVGTLQSSGAPIITGVLRGVETPSPGSDPGTITSAISSIVDSSGQSLYGANTITGFTLDRTQVASGTNGTVGTGGIASPSVATTVPAGVGTSRTTQTLTGYFGGLMTTNVTSSPYSVTGAATIATDNSANSVNATFTSDQSLVASATGGITSITMNFGGKQSVFIDDNIFGAAEDPARPQQINGQQLAVAGDTTQASRLYLVSSASATLPTSLLPSGASYCQCQYVQWGYWGGDLLTGDPSTDLVTRSDHGHINFWVAGVPTSAGDLATLASQSAVGTYTGHAIGSVSNAGSNYVAAGGFSGTYNFGTQIGTVAINNFDGKNFTATGSAPLSNGQYTLPVSQTGVAGTINGAFFGPKAAETGGNFSIHSTVGPTYLASGIFAGKQ